MPVCQDSRSQGRAVQFAPSGWRSVDVEGEFTKWDPGVEADILGHSAMQTG